jgi:hypothetical protein
VWPRPRLRSLADRRRRRAPRPAGARRTGDLHTVTCPICGPQGAIDAPLLLYLPAHNPATGQPPLLFSPAAQTSEEQDQQMAAGLLRELAGRLGDAWQDDWLAQVASVRRDLLPVALSDDPAAAMRAVTSVTRRRRQGDKERGRRRMTRSCRRRLRRN